MTIKTGIDIAAKGSTFIRGAIAAALHQNDFEGQVAHAARRWGPGSKACTFVKSAVGSAGVDDAGVLAEAGAEFIQAAAPLSILGKAAGWRFVAPAIPVAISGADLTASWVRESAAITVSKAAYERWIPRAQKISTISVFAKDLLRSADQRSEATVRTDLLRAAGLAVDQGMFNPAGDGTDGAPQSLTYDLAPVSHDGSIADAVKAAIGAFSGDLLRAIWVVHPITAAGLGVDSPMLAATSDLGARGGSLAGMPAFASAGVPLDELVLLDPGMVAVLDMGVEFAISETASLEMVDDPEQNSQAPTGPGIGNPVINLFQTDDTAIKIIRSVGWKARAGAVVRAELEVSST
jgi:hypothetical protein